jgi:hypothetical protein
VPTFADRGCRVASATVSTGVNLGFLNRSRYFSIQVAPPLSSRGSVDPVSDPLFLREPGSAGNGTRDLWICSRELRSLHHRDGRSSHVLKQKLKLLSNTNERCRYLKQKGFPGGSHEDYFPLQISCSTRTIASLSSSYNLNLIFNDKMQINA